MTTGQRSDISHPRLADCHACRQRLVEKTEQRRAKIALVDARSRRDASPGAPPQLSVRLSTPKRARAVFCVVFRARGGTPARFKSAIRPSSPNVAFPRATVQDRLALPADGAPAPFASPSPTVADIERAGEAMMNVSMRAAPAAAVLRRSHAGRAGPASSSSRASSAPAAPRVRRATLARARARPSAPPWRLLTGCASLTRAVSAWMPPSPSAPCASPPVPHAWVAPGSRPDPPPPPPPLPPLRPRWTSAILNRRLCARLLPSPSRSASSRRSRTPTWSPSSAP